MDEYDRERLKAVAQAIRDAEALGRSTPLKSLFEYLVEATLAGRAPKENEIAIELFGRRPDFDPAQDAVVRVYVHKLRRRLESFYASRKGIGERLAIPRGEYRLIVTTAPEDTAPDVRTRLGMRGLIVAALMIACLSSAATWLMLRPRPSPAAAALAEVRGTPIWSTLLSNGFPTLVVLGDYFLLGESDDGMQVSRLVREFEVNSSADLERYLVSHPDMMSRYLDLDLRYLPTSAGPALRRLAPVLDSEPKSRPTDVILASELTPKMLKSYNIVYVGYISGMGSLSNIVFGASRFAIGPTYDDILDRKTGRRYSSEGGMPTSPGAMYADYGFLSMFSGPNGNRIVVIAGTRDVALRQTAEIATTADNIADAYDKAKRSPAFEALYEVGGMSRLNVTGKLIAAAPLDNSRIWASRDAGGAPSEDQTKLRLTNP